MARAAVVVLRFMIESICISMMKEGINTDPARQAGNDLEC